MSMKDSWYSFLPKKTAVQKWEMTLPMPTSGRRAGLALTRRSSRIEKFSKETLL